MGNNAYCESRSKNRNTSAESIITARWTIAANNIVVNGFTLQGNGQMYEWNARNGKAISGFKFLYNVVTGSTVAKSAEYGVLQFGHYAGASEMQDTQWQNRYQNFEIKHNAFSGSAQNKANFVSISGAFGTTSIEDNTFTDGGTKYTVEKTLVNGEYYEYYVTYKGEKCLARVHKTMKNRYGNPIYYISKFSYQDGKATISYQDGKAMVSFQGGKAMISSPIVCRWAEVILNRAEAYAHLGQDAEALADVNVLRTRAGIPADGLFEAGKMHGYASALDVVLDERRLELAFEGFRTHDLTRNKIDIDRKYPGAQPWQIVPYNHDHLIYPIPNNEWTVSGIQQNPGY